MFFADRFQHKRKIDFYILVPTLITLTLSVLVLMKATGIGKSFYTHYLLGTYPNVIAAAVSISCLISLIFILRHFRSYDSIFSNSDDADQDISMARIVATFFGVLWIFFCLPASFRCIGDTRIIVPHWIDDAITIDQMADFLAGCCTIPSYRFTQGWPLFLTTVVASSGLSTILPVDVSFLDGFMRFQQLAILFCLVVVTFLLIYRITGSLWFSACVILISFSDISIFFTAVRNTRLDNLQVLLCVLCLYFAYSFYESGSARHWFLSIFFASCAFASRYSGHIFFPMLGTLWFLHCSNKSILSKFRSKTKCLKSSGWLFIWGMVCIFILSFFLINPYHLFDFDRFISTIRDTVRVYSSDLEFDSFKRMPQSLLSAWWHAMVAEATPEVFSKPWPSLVMARSTMVVLSIVGTVSAIVRIIVGVRKGQRLASQKIAEMLLIIWLGSYWSFVLFQFRGRFILRTCIEPIFFVMSYFAIAQFYWLFQATREKSTFPFKFARIILWVAICSWTLWYSSHAFTNSFRDLALYRDPSSSAIEVGKYLDNRIPREQNPGILNTHFAYIPARFTNVLVHNVDVTSEFIRKHRIEYIIVDDFLFDYLADIDMTGKEDLVYTRFNVKYAEVTSVFTALKNDQFPGFHLIARIGQFSIFESEDSYADYSIEWNWSASDMEGLRYNIMEDSKPSKEGKGKELFLDTNGIPWTRIFSCPMDGLNRSGDYSISGSILFSHNGKSRLGGIGVGVFDESQKTYTVFQFNRGWKGVEFSLRFPFDPTQGPVRFVVANAGRPSKQQLAIKNLRLVLLKWQKRPRY